MRAYINMFSPFVVGLKQEGTQNPQEQVCIKETKNFNDTKTLNSLVGHESII